MGPICSLNTRKNFSKLKKSSESSKTKKNRLAKSKLKSIHYLQSYFFFAFPFSNIHSFNNRNKDKQQNEKKTVISMMMMK